jgi:replicative DNA helicase
MNAVTPFDGPVTHERLLPVNIDVEQELLGALLVRGDAIATVRPILAPDHFGERLHRLVYQAILETVDAGHSPSMGSVKQFLGTWNVSCDLGGITLAQYLARVMALAPAVGALTPLAHLVRDLWAIRQIAAVSDDIGRKEEGFDPAAYLAEKFDQLDVVRASLLDRERTSATAAQAAGEVVAWVEMCLQGRAAPLPQTGLCCLDDELGGGLRPSTLIVVAARTSMGKSALGLEIADTVARQGFGCVYHSLEMSRLQLAARQISSRLERQSIRLPFSDILKGRVDVDIAERIPGIQADMRNDPLWIEEAGGVSIGQIAATSERRINAFVRKGIKPGVVVIDHAHIVHGPRRDRNGEGEIRDVSAGALAIAKRLGIPVLLLAQLNRQTEAREDKRPGPADLRGSGALEEDADTLIFPFRPAYYIERSPEFRAGNIDKIDEHNAVKHDLELIIDKNRAGRSNVVIKAWIDPALNAIRDRSGGYDYAEMRA